jgi:hypothetical protein
VAQAAFCAFHDGKVGFGLEDLGGPFTIKIAANNAPESKDEFFHGAPR